MSTEIKPGDEIVTIQDAPTLLGYALPKGTHGTVIRSGPPIVGPYSVYARFEGDRPGDGRQVRPGDVAVVPATPAPLDPSKVRVGDTVTVTSTTTAGAPYEITGVVWEPTHSPGVLWLGPVSLNATSLTLTAHRPAPEPEPEWLVGDVADITVHPSGVLRAVRARTGDYWAADTEEVYSDDDVEKVTPLVVIDPAAVDVEALAAALGREWSGKNFDASFTWGEIAVTVLTELGIEATS